ncbi:MAG: GlxA family transcriptional regulator [Acidobacteriales bacterium]|nr:GlxA family transcriptional regulator [Terriglobales bacterium]
MTLASASEPYRAANRLSGSNLYQWHLLSREGDCVASSSGLSLQTTPMESAPKLDQLFIVASMQLDKLRDPKVYRFLQRLALKGTPLGALSNGTFLLARAGLLTGYKCTLHWEQLRQFAEEFPLIPVSRELYVRDRDRLTCAGGTAAMDLMLDQIALDHGGQLAASVAEQFLHSRIREPQEQQRMAIQRRYGVNDARIAKAIMLMEQNLEQVMSVEDIAAHCNISLRQLERLWLKHFAVPPQRFYVGIRLNEAKRLLKESTESIASISLRCGFVSASHLSSAYRKACGHSPGDERRKSDRKR